MYTLCCTYVYKLRDLGGGGVIRKGSLHYTHPHSSTHTYIHVPNHSYKNVTCIIVTKVSRTLHMLTHSPSFTRTRVHTITRIYSTTLKHSLYLLKSSFQFITFLLLSNLCQIHCWCCAVLHDLEPAWSKVLSIYYQHDHNGVRNSLYFLKLLMACSLRSLSL